MLWMMRWIQIKNIFFGHLRHLFHNHKIQRWMTRLCEPSRMQRSVKIYVNCRIPRTKRDLNIYCAFGISLKACLVQCQLVRVPIHLLLLIILIFVCDHVCASVMFNACTSCNMWLSVQRAQLYAMVFLARVCLC